MLFMLSVIHTFLICLKGHFGAMDGVGGIVCMVGEAPNLVGMHGTLV